MRLTPDQIRTLAPHLRDQVEWELARPRSATAKEAAALALPAPQKPVRTLPYAPPSPSQPKPARAPRKAKERTRNGGTLTEAAFWGMVRSGLRRTFRFWKPALAALKAARVPCKGPRGQKWAYLCADCGGLFLRKQVQIDHVTPCGALTSYDHVGEFLRRLTPEGTDAFRCRCRSCHQQKTNRERNHG